MGNAITTSNCFSSSSSSSINLVFHGGATRTLTGKHLAGELMFEFPDRMLCHADSFFLGQPIPSLAIDDELVRGQTYFLLPLDCFANSVLSASSLAALGSDPNNNPRAPPLRFEKCPFEYMKGSNGRVVIKVVPEFITRLISREIKEINYEVSDANNFLCNTPELKKHYNQLVGSAKHQVWSPKLETISEYKLRFSPCRFMGLEWKQKEIES